MMKCELCERELEHLTVHHLIPKQKTKKTDPSPTIDIFSACHRQIHSLFTNTQLAQQLNTLDALKSEPQMQKFLTWVSKQNPQKRVKVHRQQAK